MVLFATVCTLRRDPGLKMQGAWLRTTPRPGVYVQGTQRQGNVCLDLAYRFRGRSVNAAGARLRSDGASGFSSPQLPVEGAGSASCGCILPPRRAVSGFGDPASRYQGCPSMFGLQRVVQRSALTRRSVTGPGSLCHDPGVEVRGEQRRGRGSGTTYCAAPQRIVLRVDLASTFMASSSSRLWREALRGASAQHSSRGPGVGVCGFSVEVEALARGTARRLDASFFAATRRRRSWRQRRGS